MWVKMYAILVRFVTQGQEGSKGDPGPAGPPGRQVRYFVRPAIINYLDDANVSTRYGQVEGIKLK